MSQDNVLKLLGVAAGRDVASFSPWIERLGVVRTDDGRETQDFCLHLPYDIRSGLDVRISGELDHLREILVDMEIIRLSEDHPGPPTPEERRQAEAAAAAVPIRNESR